jgi:arylsulfatase A-like enzyme
VRRVLIRIFLAGILVPALAACRSPKPRFETVVLVTIDTLRADHLGCYGYLRPTTPFLDGLAQRSLLFRNAIASSSHTAPSHASLFTSLYPAQHQVLVNGVVLSPDIPSLAGLFGSAGYQTAGFTGVGFLASLESGFEHLDTDMPEKARYRPADHVVDRALQWWARRDRSRGRFLWVHLYDPHEHGPRAEIPASHLETMRADSESRGQEFFDYLEGSRGISVSDLESSFDRYDAQIAFADAQLQRLFEATVLEENGPSLWVVTADHGEGMGSHGYIGHGQYLYAEQLRVPLLIHASDGSLPARQVQHLVRHVDLMPTMLELAEVGFDRDAARIEGHSFVPLCKDQGASVPIDFAFAQRRPADARRLELGWIDGSVIAGQDSRYKYILSSRGPDELYDLQTDPLELHNLIDQQPPETQRLYDWLTRKYHALQQDARSDSSKSQQIEERFLENLKALGYIQ